MALTLQQMINGGLLETLSNVANDTTVRQMLLLGIGFGQGEISSFETTGGVGYWLNACRLIDAGRVSGTLDDLMRGAARQWPSNSAFAPWRATPAAAGQSAGGNGGSPSGIYVFIDGVSSAIWPQVFEELQRLSRVAGAGDVFAQVGSVESAGFRLPQAGPEAASRLASEAQHWLRGRGFSHARVQWSVERFQDYLINPVYVSGPDQTRFQLDNVPASTPLLDVTKKVIEEYDAEWPKDKLGQPAPATVDVMNADGGLKRLDQEKSLHENQVQDGDTLHIGRQAQAGSTFNRDQGLARARAQVVSYAESHPGFKVEANGRKFPTEYVFSFNAPSWGPPAAPDGPPVEIDQHEVLLRLLDGFPMEAPEAFWQTPIFHPNVHAGSGWVCLGVLRDAWRPGLDFAQICQELVDIARYANYEIFDIRSDIDNGDMVRFAGVNEKAGRWAVEEQDAIVARGGRSLLRRHLGLTEPPRSLRLKRI